ncbi:KUP/HAK/KT family potassium transporter [Acidiferrobacter sp.]|uniref:potassium transporter Kup n=1 Tax=Acidiferrobacter sp. TaxID=1872107 RepID=UPI00263409F5|nr:KUP/HAK/KT family potassium transporter [Acidiferrobacter sp.]
MIKDAKAGLPWLALAALGVVFGDIGTSPLYTLSACLTVLSMPATPAHLLGVISLILWTLILVVAVKYAWFVMRADEHGEGGIMVITALASRGQPEGSRMRWAILALGLLGASLFYGDGAVTPAISVLSALQGMEVASARLTPLVVPLSVGIIVGLFWIQRRGTAAISRFFGPAMLAWFLILLVSGVIWVAQAPSVIRAFDPWLGLHILVAHGAGGLTILGAVVLAVTGAEALYADLGHFGTRPIRLAWYFVVFPALACNYLGQGALLILHPAAAQNPFFNMFPAWATIPMVLVSGIATVIASQSIITGAYSATRQASMLGYLPRLTIRHTSASERGQIYLPGLNWILMIAVILIILAFRSSDALSFAYGTAVTGTMLFTTILVFFVARQDWRWPLWKAGLFSGFFVFLDGVFFGANLLKFVAGGWVPVAIGLAVFTLMSTWRRGRTLLIQALSPESLSIPDFLEMIATSTVNRVPGTAVFLTVRVGGIPHTLLHNLKHNKVLHERVVILTIQFESTPRIAPTERMTIRDYGKGLYSLTARYGFMEHPDIPGLLEGAPLPFPWNRADTTYFISRQHLLPKPGGALALWRQRLFAVMLKASATAIDFFHLPANQVMELGDIVELPDRLRKPPIDP